MALTLDRIMELVRKHDALGADIARLDAQRAALDDERAAVKDELEGRMPGRRAATVREPAKALVVAATPGSTRSAPPSTAGKVVAELAELRPWFGELTTERMRKMTEMRADGKKPEDIAKALKATASQVSSTVWNAMNKLRAARQAGAKAKPEKTPASDAEDEPGAPEVLDELDAYNASTVAPVPAPSADSRKLEVDHVTRMSDSGADGRASATDGSGTADGAGAATDLRSSALGASVDRKPGEIDPEVDLSEFFADEPAPAPSPDVEGEGQEGRNAEKLAELQALREYFHGLSPNQRYIVEATIDGVEQETMAARQGASRQSIRTSLAMAISRLRELKAVAAAGRAFVPIERVRGKTIGLHPLGRRDWNRLNDTVGTHHADQAVDYPDDVERPRTRGDCQDMPRPCPFVSCRHHLYLDVHPDTGSIKLNFGAVEVDELRESCALDVADRGGVTLEETGAILNLTRERIRQIEVRGLESAATNVRRRKIAVDLPDDDDDHESPMAALQRAS